uniref:Uncharacterized protein n=1 Tax=Anguilla anguilla TaxID=7936 RepID=A0A0E9U612_ANGAN
MLLEKKKPTTDISLVLIRQPVNREVVQLLYCAAIEYDVDGTL